MVIPPVPVSNANSSIEEPRQSAPTCDTDISAANGAKVFPLLACGRDLVEQYVIYGLVDPEEPQRVRYVGRSSTPSLRLIGHIQGSSSTEILGEWIDHVRGKGRLPDMVLLEHVPVGGWGRERHWYEHLRARAQADLNGHAPKRCYDFKDDRRPVSAGQARAIAAEGERRQTVGFWAERERYAAEAKRNAVFAVSGSAGGGQ